MNRTAMTTEAKAWIKRSQDASEIVRIVPHRISINGPASYNLFTAYDENYLGRILFDAQGYWIYDGQLLTVAETEQLAKFIMNYKGAV